MRWELARPAAGRTKEHSKHAGISEARAALHTQLSRQQAAGLGQGRRTQGGAGGRGGSVRSPGRMPGCDRSCRGQTACPAAARSRRRTQTAAGSGRGAWEGGGGGQRRGAGLVSASNLKTLCRQAASDGCPPRLACTASICCGVSCCGVSRRAMEACTIVLCLGGPPGKACRSRLRSCSGRGSVEQARSQGPVSACVRVRMQVQSCCTSCTACAASGRHSPRLPPCLCTSSPLLGGRWCLRCTAAGCRCRPSAGGAPRTLGHLQGGAHVCE